MYNANLAKFFQKCCFEVGNQNFESELDLQFRNFFTFASSKVRIFFEIQNKDKGTRAIDPLTEIKDVPCNCGTNLKVANLQVDLAHIIFLFQKISDNMKVLDFEMLLGYEHAEVTQIYHRSVALILLAY